MGDFDRLELMFAAITASLCLQLWDRVQLLLFLKRVLQVIDRVIKRSTNLANNGTGRSRDHRGARLSKSETQGAKSVIQIC